MDRELETLCKALVTELKLGAVEDVSDVRPLTGGVASDIASLKIGDDVYCMKFAREKLQVAEEWFAPVHRNEAEYAWLSFVGEILPECAPKLYGQSKSLSGFAMEFVSGEQVYLWKDELLRGQASPEAAQAVAACLGKIHSASAKPNFVRHKFNNHDDFNVLRLEPYLGFLARKHAVLAENINVVERRLVQKSDVLVHGDVSPKNILFKNGCPIILDAECATMGDASFDPSFCLNHLILKAFNSPANASNILDMVKVFWSSYSNFIDWEDRAHLEERVCALVPILMLARIDGKSPVEYLSNEARDQVRSVSMPLISHPRTKLSDLIGLIKTELS